MRGATNGAGSLDDFLTTLTLQATSQELELTDDGIVIRGSGASCCPTKRTTAVAVDGSSNCGLDLLHSVFDSGGSLDHHQVNVGGTEGVWGV
jgi:hypothetical protein